MQTNVSLGGKTVAVGLEWTVISKDNPARKRDIKKACDESGFSNGIVAEGQGRVAAVGLCPKKSEHPSAAALLAAANREKLKNVGFGDDETNSSWIVVEKVKSGAKAGSYWLCGITDGVPVPGTDITEDLTTISGKLAELLEILEEVDIYSPDAEIQDYVRDASPAIDKGFVELTESIHLSKGGRPQKVQGIPESAYLAMAGIIVLAVGGVGYSMYSDAVQKELAAKKMREAKTKAEQMALMQKAEADSAYANESEAKKAAEIGKIKATLSFSPEVMAKAWSDALGKLPLDHGGWNVAQVSCDQRECEILLDRDDLVGTNEALLEIVPAAQILDERRASYRIEVSATPKDPDMAGLATWDVFAREGVSRLQELKLAGISGKIGPKQMVTFTPPPIAGNSGQSMPVPPKPLGLEMGNLSLNGGGAWQIESLAEVVRQKEFALERLDVNFGGRMIADAAWKISGKYVVKSGAAPELAVPGGPVAGLTETEAMSAQRRAAETQRQTMVAELGSSEPTPPPNVPVQAQQAPVGGAAR